MDDEYLEPASEPTRASFLTPEAAAIAALVFAVVSTGVASIGNLVAQAFVGVNAADAFRSHRAIAAGVHLAFAVLAVVLGRHAVASPDTAEPWTDHVSRAAMVVAIVAGGLAIVVLVGTLLQNSPDHEIFDR